MSAHLRDETEGARAVAPFGDLDKRAVAGRGEDARRRFVVEISRALIAERDDGERARVDFVVADFRDVVDLIRADEGVNFGNLRAQLVSITLDETARDDEPLGFPVRLHARRFEDRVN
jgi:hypothetical protein